MDTQPFDAEELEVILIQAMVQLIVRTPNGYLRIERALDCVRRAEGGLLTREDVAEIKRQRAFESDWN